jgi:hypothetical protein
MPNYDIGIDRPSHSHWVPPYQQHPDLRLAGLPQYLPYGPVTPCVNFAGQEQTISVRRYK